MRGERLLTLTITPGLTQTEIWTVGELNDATPSSCGSEMRGWEEHGGKTALIGRAAMPLLARRAAGHRNSRSFLDGATDW